MLFSKAYCQQTLLDVQLRLPSYGTTHLLYNMDRIVGKEFVGMIRDATANNELDGEHDLYVHVLHQVRYYQLRRVSYSFPTM